MTRSAEAPVLNVLADNLRVALEGTDHDWYVGLLTTLTEVSAEQASRASRAGGSTIAAHANHVRFALRIMLGRLHGERGPVEWGPEWERSRVDDAEWDALRTELGELYQEFAGLLRSRTVWDEQALGVVMTQIAHTAYHVGAIRQVKLAVSAPSA
ncbi:putative damage-inducible protein DinB [Deinobacterium chartae]|uniref:Putative damage-inducible protein DinB n=1 Tax=Deinobacterium chartae TaxID=521158 RepID=A0A841I5X5_9DEIO|nr:DinB family protein [Deinobacterium chartae]MBB6099858.1 putative damage-inducible protein DinB [Deinobacterium chartae]